MNENFKKGFEKIAQGRALNVHRKGDFKKMMLGSDNVSKARFDKNPEYFKKRYKNIKHSY